MSDVSSPPPVDPDLEALARGVRPIAPEERRSILRETDRDLDRVAERWVEANLRQKGVPPGGFAECEEWLIFGALRALVRKLAEPPRPGPIVRRPDGSRVRRIFPTTLLERLAYVGIRGEARLGAPVAPPRKPGVCVVLGAGNLASIPAADALHMIFVEGQAVLLKPSPIHVDLIPILREAFASLIRRDLLRIVEGGPETGAALCRHPRVDSIHVTGSDRTYEAIVASSDKPVTAELGGVGPILVVPGPWTEDDLARQASLVATALAGNAGFNCITPRVLVQDASWPLRGRFLDAIGRALEAAPPRPSFYPGSREMHDALVASHPTSRRFAEGTYTLATGITPDDPIFRREHFCPFLAEVPINGTFIESAVAFANDRLWGNLAVTLLVHPDSWGPKIDRAIADLRYGLVTVNLFAGYPYLLMAAPWGAYPGNTRADIQSGIGVVNNPMALEGIEKSVFTAPFRRYDPIHLRARRPHVLGRRLSAFQGRPSLGKLPGLAAAVLRSAAESREFS